MDDSACPLLEPVDFLPGLSRGSMYASVIFNTVLLEPGSLDRVNVSLEPSRYCKYASASALARELFDKSRQDKNFEVLNS